MSKSDPNSAIFMEDSEVEVNSKIKKAYCPPQVVAHLNSFCMVAAPGLIPNRLLICCVQVVEGNPILEYCEHIVMPRDGRLVVSRSENNGGPVTYTAAEDLRRDYESGALHPGVVTLTAACTL
jgi:tyrosyl-tRNA synthetase